MGEPSVSLVQCTWHNSSLNDLENWLSFPILLPPEYDKVMYEAFDAHKQSHILTNHDSDSSSVQFNIANVESTHQERSEWKR